MRSHEILFGFMRFSATVSAVETIMRLTLSLLLLAAAAACGNHDGGSGGNGKPDAAPDAPPCEGIGCMQVKCDGGGTTSISGRVFAPNGTLPLFNATVYVPLQPVGPITTGATCDRCSELSGKPLVRAVTDEQGRFTLTNVPATNNVPLVIQIGKWRRQLTVPAVPACVDTPVDTGITRLPRNKTEGDIPLMALTTGERDALECLLRKVGLDDSEFTPPGGTGRVHLFAGFGGATKFDAANGGAAFGTATNFWATEASLSAYDVVFLSCEGDQKPLMKPLAARAAMKAYADKGGRVFASHWHNYWIQAGPPPWNQALTFQFQNDLGTITADIDANFPKSDSLATWLLNVGASTVRGKLPLVDTQHTITGVNATYAERWIHLDTNANGTPAVQYVSMQTPLEATNDQKCGRLVLSDIHVSTGDKSAADLAFPSQGCTTNKAQLTPQEKMLAFMIFDIASCVGDPIE
jgi:hypothetical protein